MNIAKAVLCNPNMVTPEMCIKIGQTISDAISLLKEQAERIKTLEHRLETITEWRAKAGAFD